MCGWWRLFEVGGHGAVGEELGFGEAGRGAFDGAGDNFAGAADARFIVADKPVGDQHGGRKYAAQIVTQAGKLGLQFGQAKLGGNGGGEFIARGARGRLGGTAAGVFPGANGEGTSDGPDQQAGQERQEIRGTRLVHETIFRDLVWGNASACCNAIR